MFDRPALQDAFFSTVELVFAEPPGAKGFGGFEGPLKPSPKH